jgi:hypothetical protein
MKRLLVCAALVGALLVPAVASADTPLLSFSGTAVRHGPHGYSVDGLVQTYQTEDLTVTATFQGKNGGVYLVELYDFYHTLNAECQTWASDTSTSASCTIHDAPSGLYAASFALGASGSIDVAVTVTTP